MTTLVRQVQVPIEPSMKDLLDLFRKDVLQNLNCHHVGTIESFNADDQLATATINYTQTYFEYNQAAGTYENTAVEYPILIDCPVICLGGGPASLTFPIQPGDECLVLFNDRDLDNWFNKGPGAPPTQVATPRLHSFSDGIIIVGLRSGINRIKNYDTTNAVLQNGMTKISVGPSSIGLSNVSTSLGVQISNLLSALSNFMQTCESSTDTTLSGAATTAKPLIDTVKSALGGLLT